MITPVPSFPPLVPTDETVLASDPAFESECMSAISDQAKDLRWRFRSSVLTKSEKWGIIWRVDFDTPESANTSFINRVTCWRTPEETGNGPTGICFAIGQRVSPLGI